MNKQIVVVLVIMVIIVLFWKSRELFGESIYSGSNIDLNSDQRANIYSAGATMRNVGTMFSMTNQDTQRVY